MVEGFVEEHKFKVGQTASFNLQTLRARGRPNDTIELALLNDSLVRLSGTLDPVPVVITFRW
jgi:hypothetical protein